MSWGFIKGIFVFSMTKWPRRILIYRKLKCQGKILRSKKTGEFIQISHNQLFFFCNYSQIIIRGESSIKNNNDNCRRKNVVKEREEIKSGETMTEEREN